MSIRERMEAMAEKMSRQQLEQSIRNGVLPAYIGIPLLEEKVQDEKRMQMAAMSGQQQAMPIAQRVMQESEQLGIEALPTELAEYAHGGIVAFDDGGQVERYASRGLIIPDELRDRLNFGDVRGVEDEDLMARFENSQGLPVLPTSLAQEEEQEAPAGIAAINLSDVLKRVRGEMGQSAEEKAYADYLTGQRARSAEQAQQDRAMNFINLGAQILGSEDPNAIRAIGKGVMQAVPGFARSAQAQRAAEAESLKGLAELSRQQRQGELATGLTVAQLEAEAGGRKEAAQSRIRAAQIGALKDRNTFGDRQVQRMANSVAQQTYNKPLEELPAEVQRVLLGDAATGYQRTLQAAQFAGVNQRDMEAYLTNQFRQDQLYQDRLKTATNVVEEALRKTSDSRSLEYRNLMDSGDTAGAAAYRQQLIDAAMKGMEKGSATPSAKPTATPAAKAAPATAAIPGKAIEYLKANNNPSMRAAFDAKYGKGAAARALGG
jgi:hypothetical protein